MVSYKCPTCKRNLYRFEKHCESFVNMYCCSRNADPNKKQYLSIPVYTIFKNLTIILIVSSGCCQVLFFVNILFAGVW